MAVVGFALNKILIERKEEIKGKIEVKSKLNITNVKKQETTFKLADKDVIRFNFEYDINYEPDLAKIVFNGHILFMVDPKQTTGILKEWKKKQRIAQELDLPIRNTIFQKCNIKAFELEEDFNLPPHLPLPRLTTKTETGAGYTG